MAVDLQWVDIFAPYASNSISKPCEPYCLGVWRKLLTVKAKLHHVGVMRMWIDIKNYEGIYQINEYGQVKRLAVSKHSKGNRDRILKYDVNNMGYLRVTLSKDNKTKRFLVHKLVYESFIGEIPENMTINHKNLVKKDNNLNNLELISQQENNQLKSNIKLDKSKVLAIRKSKLSSNSLAQIYNVHQRTIERVRNKDRWANI